MLSAMEFGKISNIDRINWKIPADVPSSMCFLNSLPKTSPTKYFIGTPAWAHKEWIGKIYPPKTKSTDFLHHYSQSFNTIELNTSHYRIPNAEQTKKWLEQVTANFLFCPKIFQNISHYDSGLLDKKLHQEWFSFLENLKDHCGPSFIQLPPSFDYSKKALLFQFLLNWPESFPLALEFRHPSWFADGKIIPALEKYLQSRKIGLVITDVAGRRDVLHTSLTSDFTMLRFIGNNLDPSDFTRTQAWAERLRQWGPQGLQKVFYFTHEPDDILAPEMAQFVIKELNEVAGANLTPLKWCAQDTTQITLDFQSSNPHRP